MKFSIVTPSFKQLDWLKLCIASIRDQVQLLESHSPPHALSPSHGLLSPNSHLLAAQQPLPASPSTLDPRPSTLSVEHIIQDAGTPGIEDLARELGAEFHRNGQLVFKAQPSAIRYQPSAIGCSAALKIFTEPDAGMYDAVNRGLARATGDLCAYLNSDDQYLPGTLATVAEFFEKNPSTEMLFGDAIVVDPDGHYLCSRIVTIPSAWHTQVHTLSIFTAATFFRRALVTEKNIRFRPEWKIIGDAVWILDHLHANTRMALLRKPAATATETGENLILSQKTRAESHRFHSQAPPFAKALAPALILHHRLKRLLRGSYSPPAEPYAIYTKTSPTHRISFTPKNPTHRLPCRFG